MAAGPAPTAFDFRLAALEGGELDLGALRGRVLLVVNTASFCGYTPQYAALQRLHDRFEQRGLTVIGVPSNDFRQESTEAARIRAFCDAMYGITFPMAGLTAVRGAEAHPLYAWMAREGGGPPRWNFHKYLIGREGRVARSFGTAVEPDSMQLVRAVETALAGRAGA
jgi:glutathione peroxidase